MAVGRHASLMPPWRKPSSSSIGWRGTYVQNNFDDGNFLSRLIWALCSQPASLLGYDIWLILVKLIGLPAISFSADLGYPLFWYHFNPESRTRKTERLKLVKQVTGMDLVSMQMDLKAVFPIKHLRFITLWNFEVNGWSKRTRTLELHFEWTWQIRTSI
jgi:hypothetical protein